MSQGETGGIVLKVQDQIVSALAYVRAQNPSLAECGPDFLRRLEAHFPALLTELSALYGARDDFLDALGGAVGAAAAAWRERPTDLRALDARREARPNWHQSEKMVGGVCYVDRYAGTFKKLEAEVPYFKSLGLTYFHAMPPFLRPAANSDGGYAVSSYRAVDPALGSIGDLRAFASALREQGMSLCLDFIFNHTSNEHEWAQKAAAGDPEHSAYYWIFPDRKMPDAFERTTREIFPDDHPGSFVQLPDGRWIWSTFYHFQWDLNYSNPAVFRAMAGEMLFLANLGVEIMRMDAVAFAWKRLGTPCESQPEAHVLIRAFNALCRIAAPAMLFKSEAIVHPDEVVSYISPEEAPLSYNPLVMALSWEALATRDATLLSQAMRKRQSIPAGCSWVNYVRCHDDIGWTFADEDAAEVGIDGFRHRRFLNAFYVNRFEGSFARGLPFQDNPRTGDCRIAGTCASLAGVEAGDPGGVARVALLHSVALAAAGVPLIYLGDEVGQLNDRAYADDPATAGDSRWAHRPRRPNSLYEAAKDGATIPGQIATRLKRLMETRRATQEFAGQDVTGFDAGEKSVLAFVRPGRETSVIALANFADEPRRIAPERFGAFGAAAQELIGGRALDLRSGVELPAHGAAWLRVSPA